MANKKQRMKNRSNAQWLRHQHKCPNCMERGRHFAAFPQTLEEIIKGVPAITFWTCPKFANQQQDRVG
jgi:hypothetical protein